MIIIDSDLLIVSSHAEHIENQKLLDAYFFLVGAGANSRKFKCEAVNKGVVRDFRFFENESQPFAFIVNKRHLTFYFRKPALESLKFSVNNLEIVFGSKNIDQKKPPRFECSVRIHNLVEAQKLSKFVFED